MYVKFFKRFFDLMLGIISLPFLGLATLVIALLIKAEDRGPILYNAPRVGRGGRIFTMYKFRTMCVDAPDLRLPDGSSYNAPDDPRMTKIGAKLRRSSVDELPQILNIIRGEMSFIGPRPDLEEEAARYEGDERLKLGLRPGISGYAQVYGRNAITWRERLALDVEYVHMVNPLLDIRIFFRTFVVVFSGEGIYVELPAEPRSPGARPLPELVRDPAAYPANSPASGRNASTFAYSTEEASPFYNTPTGHFRDHGLYRDDASTDPYRNEASTDPYRNADPYRSEASADPYRNDGSYRNETSTDPYRDIDPTKQYNNKAPIDIVSLVVVAYNEEHYLPLLLFDILSQDYPHYSIELLLVDSNAGANSEQRQLLEEAARMARSNYGFWRAEVLDNPVGLLPHGNNVALAVFQGDVFLRVDAHARIPTDFVRRSVEVLEEGHDVCGGLRPVILDDPSAWEETLLAAESSAFGASPASYRRASGACEVSSVFHGAYRREVFEQVGYFDERLFRCEDNDISQRIRAAGYHIWMDPRIRSEQYLRPGFKALARQKGANGFWIGRTLWLNPKAVSLMHLVPFAFVLALLITLIPGLLLSWLPFLTIAYVYAFANAVFSLIATIKQKEAKLPMLALPLVFLAMHLCYGFGTLAGLIRGAYLALSKA